MVESNSVDKVRSLFFADEPIKAYEELKKLDPSLSSVQDFLNSEEMTQLRHDYANITNFLRSDEQQSFDAWTRHKDSPGYKIFYKYVPDHPICSVYIERIVEAPILNIMALIFECDLYKDWVPLVIHQDCHLQKLSHLRMCGSNALYAPWPFTNRSFCLQTAGMKLPDQ